MEVSIFLLSAGSPLLYLRAPAYLTTTFFFPPASSSNQQHYIQSEFKFLSTFLLLHPSHSSQRKFSAFKSLCDQLGLTQIMHDHLPILRLITLIGGGGTRGKEPACKCRRHKRHRFHPWVGKIPWRRAWQPTPVFLPGESHGQRGLAGYSPRGRKESDTTEVTQHTRNLNYVCKVPFTMQGNTCTGSRNSDMGSRDRGGGDFCLPCEKVWKLRKKTGY